MSKVCDHDWVFDSQTATTITHKCRKCGAKSSQPRQSGRADFAYKLLAVLIFLAGMTPIWLVASHHP